MMSSSSTYGVASNKGGVKALEEETAREMIDKLAKDEGNDVCADCGEVNPQWASVNFGVFICINCAGIHRSLTGVSSSKVRSVRLDTWTSDMVHSLASIGNKKARDRFEAKVPPCWLKPQPNSRQICHEQWIKAKYERLEFVPEIDEVKRSYTTGTRQGYLTKRKKDADEWKNRWFVLTRDYLSYYINYQDKSPKACIPLSHLNATLQVPGMEARSNTMLIAFHDPRVRKTRNIFVYTESGKEIMDWFCAIRMAKIKLLQDTFPERPQEIIAQKASRDFVHFGYLEKMPSNQAKWQKRFFVLDQNSLRYYERPSCRYRDKQLNKYQYFPCVYFKDPHAHGEIILGSSLDGYYVDENVPAKLADRIHIFMLHVPGRGGGGFPLLADSLEEKEEWMTALTKVINESTGSPDQSVAPSTYEEDEDLYATVN